RGSVDVVKPVLSVEFRVPSPNSKPETQNSSLDFLWRGFECLKMAVTGDCCYHETPKQSRDFPRAWIYHKAAADREDITDSEIAELIRLRLGNRDHLLARHPEQALGIEHRRSEQG